MKFFLIIICVLTGILAEGSDWDDKSSWATDDVSLEDNEINTLYEKTKIQNRANEVYTDRIYKYITGDYYVENNNIELGTIKLNDNFQDQDIEINMYVDNLDVEGNSYKDGIDLRKNRYKYYVNRDENHPNIENDFFQEGKGNDYQALSSDYGDKDSQIDKNANLSAPIRYEDAQFREVENRDISIIETLDLRDLNALKEVNVLVEDVNIIVK
jgi:hypothetical protein